MSRSLLAVFAGLLWITVGCKQQDAAGPSYDRAALLTHAADHIIAPAYQKLSVAADSQASAVARFTQSPSVTTLAQAQAAFRTAFLASQGILYTDFGPADLGNAGMLLANVGTFPADIARIESAISASQALQPNSRYPERRGFAALDYLLFSDSAAVLVARFAESPSRAAYALAAAQDIAAKARTVAQAWPAYRAQFVASAGTEAGSGTSDYYNAFVYGYEWIKNFKVAVPAGRMAGQTTTAPERAEAYYSGLSREALLANLALLKAIYTGDTEHQPGPGWDDYLKSVPGGPELLQTTTAQMATIDATLAALPAGSLSDLARANKLDNLSTELQKNTRYLKSDMSSLIGIAITFSSGDGD